MIERSAGVVITRREGNDWLFLLLHYSAGHWDFAKGHLEKGESDVEAALREVVEETGISNVVLCPDFREEINYFFQRDKLKVSKSVVFFVGKTKTKKVVLSHEHQGFAWLSFDNAVKKLTFDNAKEVLKAAYAFLRNEES